MSHCTSFTMTFQDKRTLFRAMRSRGFQPENRVWVDYQSQFKKRLNIGGTIIGKLLTGMKDGIHVFFVESEGGMIPHFESDILSPEELEKQAQVLLTSIREGYLHYSVEAVTEWITNAGGTVSVSEEKSGAITSFVLTIGQSEKKVSISMDSQGKMEEKVEGVLGRSCVELTELMEQKLCGQNQVERVWTHEYDTTVEDQQIQILRLS
ncbi:DUF2997 domain-containing protein [Brevibacillus sp. HB1.4B]|uniref:DUF2997 domain-containing protein n=1 Tax=Brevibacillus TaxID=55080 RepID=UPI00156BAF0F|nr:DUF2997 domain-containing protein [Brevibacillus sp. HB1.4B]